VEQIPSGEAHTSSTSHEMSFILRNSKVSYCLHKSPAFVSILRQVNPVYVIPSDFINIHFNIILPRSPSSSKWFPWLSVSHGNSSCTWPLPLPSSYVLYYPQSVDTYLPFYMTSHSGQFWLLPNEVHKIWAVYCCVDVSG
jgi:hypothetical protein